MRSADARCCSRLVAAEVSAFLAGEYADSFRGGEDARGASALAADVDALCEAWRPFASHPHALFKARASEACARLRCRVHA
jgi:hypothetical protein